MGWILSFMQVLTCALMGVYFFKQLFPGKKRMREGDAEKYRHLCHMKAVSLTPPLSEKVRPKELCEIVGQEDALRALRAALFGKYPQHVILYGPPGVGKTCAARLIFEEARKSRLSPFHADAPFIEVDASTLRFDERGIADPLMGSVHDPIYQGAGERGALGVPQPREGAVTRAHGGILFLDEIGEMHPNHMNRLLKVMEDRRVRLESAYYDAENPHLTDYVRDVFENGLPADFRLIAATTRSPAELPDALRSRAIEIFFKPLSVQNLSRIARGAAWRAGFRLEESLSKMFGECAQNGRDCVSLVQLAAGAVTAADREQFLREDVEWAIEAGGRANAKADRLNRTPRAGVVNALAVNGGMQGIVTALEAVALPGSGRIFLNGAPMTEEILLDKSRRLTKSSGILSAAENARTYLRSIGYALSERDVIINFPSLPLADGPSAGAAIAVAVASYMDCAPVRSDCAITGEISLTGAILPVGGTLEKAEAARRAGLREVFLPAGSCVKQKRMRVTAVASFEQAYARMLVHPQALKDEIVG